MQHMLMQRLATAALLRNPSASQQLLRLRLYHGRALIGKREVVGFGTNGSYSYIDTPDYPHPAIRFREDDAALTALRAKEKGDWKNLTIDEKKTLYRASYCRTYAEMLAPTGNWKAVTAGALFILSIGIWFSILAKKFLLPPLPESTSLENRIKALEFHLKNRTDPIDGISSEWDYKNNCWKK